jgi:hypothetical protein
MEDLDVVEYGVGQPDSGAPALPVEQLDLHRGPEGLDHGVVQAVADCPERRHQASGADFRAEGPRRELDSAVGLHDAAGGRPPVLDRMSNAFTTRLKFCTE